MSNRESLLGKPGYAYSTLNTIEQEAYIRLYDTIAQCDRIRVSDYPALEREDISRLLACIDMDHPELFWMDGYQSRLAIADSIGAEEAFDRIWESFSEGVDYNGDGKISLFERRLAASRVILDANPLVQWAIKDELKMPMFWNASRRDAIQYQFDDYVRDCKLTVPTYADDYTVFRRVFEYVARHTQYSLQKASQSQDVRSVFVDKESVCKGYAEALQYLLLELGIPCFTVQGMASVSDGAEEAHAWNYVLIDDVWNVVDVTAGDWDLESNPDRMPDIPDRIRDLFVDYRFMNVTDQSRRAWDIVKLPATGTTSDYFEREGFVLEPENWVSLAGICLKLFNGSEPFVMARCDDEFSKFDVWMGSSFDRIIKICVAAGSSYESLMSDPQRFYDTSQMVDRQAIVQTGWGGFGLDIQHLSANPSVLVLTASTQPPSEAWS